MGGSTRMRVGVGMVGYGFMGRAHSHALRNVASVFPELGAVPRMVSLCGRDESAVSLVADTLGWDGYDTDWRELVNRDDIDVVIVGTPGSSHADIAIAALEAGKHVLCEKPLANTVEQADLMVAAAAAAHANGVQSMLAHNYRRLPAMEVARRLVADGKLGTIRQVRVAYLQDWLVDENTPMSWRLVADQAGTGALGDIGSHALDIAQHVVGDVLIDVQALLDTQVRERPAADGTGTRQVTVDDIAMFMGRFSGGAVASFEASRMATGCKNALRLEVFGSHGAVRFDMERLDELWILNATAPGHSGFRRVLVTEPDDPWMSAWWPPGHIIGWEHTFTHQLHDLLDAIVTGVAPSPSFDDGLALQHSLAAIARAAATGNRESIPSRRGQTPS